MTKLYKQINVFLCHINQKLYAWVMRDFIIIKMILIEYLESIYIAIFMSNDKEMMSQKHTDFMMILAFWLSLNI